MINKFRFILVSLFLTLGLNAQQSGWIWAKSVNGTGGAYAIRSATDPFGNVYISGYFPIDTMIIDQDTLFHTNNYGSDVFLIKMDAMGNVIWTRNYPSGRSFSNDDYDHDIACDRLGNVYVTAGLYLDSASYDIYTLYNNDPSQSMSPDAVIIKFDSSGTISWAKNSGGIRGEQVQGVTTDQNLNVYVTGNFDSDTIVFGNDTLHARIASMYDGQVFLLKYDSLGNELWARQSTGDTVEIVRSIACDSLGNIFLAGLYNSGSIQFGSLTAQINNGYFDIFLVKYDSGGNAIWMSCSGGADDDRANAVAVDISGKIIVTGCFRSSAVSFGAQTLSNVIGAYNMFVVKYDSAGNVIWAANDLTGNGSNVGVGVCVNSSNEIWVTGFFSGTDAAFGSDTLINTTTLYMEIFLLKYDSNGNSLFATSLAGFGDDQGNHLTTDANGDIYMTGYYWNSLIVGPFQLSHNGNGGTQIFIAKLSATTFADTQESIVDFNVYPNPAEQIINISFSGTFDKNVTIQVTDITGALVQIPPAVQLTDETYRLNVGGLPAGMYFLNVRDESTLHSYRFVKM